VRQDVDDVGAEPARRRDRLERALQEPEPVPAVDLAPAAASRRRPGVRPTELAAALAQFAS
jgi:hypothetical protein